MVNVGNLKRFSLHDRTALITGASGLLGREHAVALLECEAKLVITDINQESLLKLREDLLDVYPDATIDAYVMDVVKQDIVTGVADKIAARGMCIDILVNNAAIDPKVDENNTNVELSRLENISLFEWERQIQVGLTGAFICSQIFGTQMAKRKRGVILNIASDLSVIAPDQRLYRKEDLAEDLQPVKPVTYSVIKTGLVGLTRYLATYWASSQVRSNSLSPGGIYFNQPEEFVKKISSLIPLGRMANQDEYHSAIQFLCSDASSYLNGQNIVMDGGRSVW